MNQINYVSFLDDDRITLEMAIRYAALEAEYWEEGEHEFLEEIFNNLPSHKNILFPIKDIYELKTRFKEILCFVQGVDYDQFHSSYFLRAAAKMATKDIEDRITFTSDTFGKYGNPELQMVLHTFKQIFKNDGTAFFSHSLGYTNKFVQPDNGHKEIVDKLSCWWAGVIWTQSNVGSYTHNSARAKSDVICSENNVERLKGAYLNNAINKAKTLRVESSDSSVEYSEFNINAVKLTDDLRINNQPDEIFLTVDGVESLHLTFADVIQAKMTNMTTLQIERDSEKVTISFLK